MTQTDITILQSTIAAAEAVGSFIAWSPADGTAFRKVISISGNSALFEGGVSGVELSRVKLTDFIMATRLTVD